MVVLIDLVTYIVFSFEVSYYADCSGNIAEKKSERFVRSEKFS